ncbi:MAG: hypothetical protein ACJAYU_003371 [Bradymonadia bacterium]|jgi:hypothetical protein
MRDLLLDYWFFLRHLKRYWMLPVVVIIGLLALVALAGGDGPVAPMIYAQ